MATRLDRLFLLLDTGSTPVVRKSAAEQLGEVQKLHPHELTNLLTKVYGFLCSTTWETRIAAGQAVEAIIKNVPLWKPPATAKAQEGESSAAEGQLLLVQFDVQKVVLHGASLLGSEGAEYELDSETLGMEQKDRLIRERRLLNKRLGLDVAGGLGLDSEELFHDEDLVMKDAPQPTAEHTPQGNMAELVQKQLAEIGGELSARERVRAKRKAKLLARQLSKDQQDPKASNGSENEAPPLKMRKSSSIVVDQPGDQDKVMVDSVPDNMLDVDQMEEWPFEGFCELLMHDLFNSSWERRHGAAIGLREVVKIHGKSAGLTIDTPENMITAANSRWLEDLAVRLTCVQALDRFGDFVSDEVVAPVRETCAQTLGVTVQHLDVAEVNGIIKALLQLLTQTQWEVRHGGLLGLKYLLAVRQDLTGSILPVVLPVLFQSLQDRDDDPRSVAAAALVPIAHVLVTDFPQQLPSIIQCLWLTLADLDDLTASTNSIMTLLSTLLSHPKLPQNSVSGEGLSDLVPRLWPFLTHNITSVRKASLETLHTLLTSYPKTSVPWMAEVLQDTMRHVYQRALQEDREENLQLVEKVWKSLLLSSSHDQLVTASGPWLPAWFCMMMQPVKHPFDPNMLIRAEHTVKEQTPSRLRQQASQQPAREQQEFIGGYQSVNLSPAAREAAVLRARIMAARLMGALCKHLSETVQHYPEGMETPLDCVSKLILFHLRSNSATQRWCSAFVVLEWARLQNPCQCSAATVSRLHECLNESVYYDEVALAFTRMQTDCRDFLAGLKQQEVNLDTNYPPGTVISLEQAQELSGALFESVRSSIKLRQQQLFEDRRQSLKNTVTQTGIELQTLTTRVLCGVAGAVISLAKLPKKLNPIIRPLMDCLKREENLQVQSHAGESLSNLLLRCTDRSPCPNPKVVKNLCTMLCSDKNKTPVIGQETKSVEKEESPATHTYSGMLTLFAQQKGPEKFQRKSSVAKKKVGLDIDLAVDLSLEEEDETRRQFLIQHRGAVLGLSTIVRNAGPSLPQTMPYLWEAMTGPLQKLGAQNTDLSSLKNNPEAAQELVNSLQVLETVAISLHSGMKTLLLEQLELLCRCLQHPYTACRHMASRCLGMLSRVLMHETLDYAMEHVLPLLGSSDSDDARQGAVEALYNIIEQLGIAIVAYVVLLVVPILGRMSDQNECVRLMATQCFATLIRLIPLEAGIPDPPTMKESLVEQREQQRKFLEQLLDGSKVEDYKVPVAIYAELRRYQQEGVNWLAFLSKYHLHGILCDDMGLGKTLMSICILAGDHYYREKAFQETKAADCASLPSLVVCPPTLTGHWVYEVEKFVSKEHLDPLHYTGPPGERAKLQKYVMKHNLVVASYDVVRNDIDFFGKLKWNYCILDEGHIIKNSRTKLSKAVKQLSCNHRLILSGTPIQNSVLELWSLFDFLLPGFLGTEKQFQTRYGRPILQSRDAKSSTKEQEAGALAMEALHRQVLPFLLRRMKEDVLKDLPPKIIQDYYCELSSLQVQLYEDFAKSRAKRSVEDSVVAADVEKKPTVHGTTHIFQALQYLRKLCNHPALVLTPSHPEYDKIIKQLQKQSSSIRDLQHSPKLNALKQLLLDCGIGLTGSEADTPVVSQHRVLLFCQLKSMLDIVEKDLLKVQMPSVTYLRLDGSVPAGNRHGIVNRFNNDPSIDILLLTTHVGGLGLNLTGADTVIFVEHDWNPMKDLQAMDRAHRIGQKKVVNVYRLITKGTLEEKIMGLQKFKLNIANTIISQENSSLASMGTDQLLDLFSLDEINKQKASQSAANPKSGVKAIIDGLDELWDETQYEREYNLDTFMQALKK